MTQRLVRQMPANTILIDQGHIDYDGPSILFGGNSTGGDILGVPVKIADRTWTQFDPPAIEGGTLRSAKAIFLRDTWCLARPTKDEVRQRAIVCATRAAPAWRGAVPEDHAWPLGLWFAEYAGNLIGKNAINRGDPDGVSLGQCFISQDVLYLGADGAAAVLKLTKKGKLEVRAGREYCGSAGVARYLLRLARLERVRDGLSDEEILSSIETIVARVSTNRRQTQLRQELDELRVWQSRNRRAA